MVRRKSSFPSTQSSKSRVILYILFLGLRDFQRLIDGSLRLGGSINLPHHAQGRQYGPPGPDILPEGRDITLPSRDAGRAIPCRVFYPNSNPDNNKGLMIHIHGGGWVLGDERSSDILLKDYADGSGLTVISIGYRLAPEHPFPAGPEDCYDAAEYLVDKGEAEFGGPLRFVGGEVCINLRPSHLSSNLTITLMLSFTMPSCSAKVK